MTRAVWQPRGPGLPELLKENNIDPKDVTCGPSTTQATNALIEATFAMWVFLGMVPKAPAAGWQSSRPSETLAWAPDGPSSCKTRYLCDEKLSDRDCHCRNPGAVGEGAQVMWQRGLRVARYGKREAVSAPLPRVWSGVHAASEITKLYGPDPPDQNRRLQRLILPKNVNPPIEN